MPDERSHDDGGDALLSVADELYALPLGDFTPARDARVKELKADQETKDLSARVKALRKPSTAAWVVNLLVRHETEQVDQVLDVGAALREAQASMSGDDLRALTRQRRQLTAAVTTRARKVASRHGQRVTPAVADQVEATLSAAMVDADCGRALRSGLLVAPLTTTGFNTANETELANLLAVPQALGFNATPVEEDPAEEPPRRPDLRVVPDPDAEEKARAAAQEALDQAESGLVDAQEAHREAAAAVEDLEARSMQLQARVEELKRDLAQAQASYDEVDDDLAEAEEARDETRETLGESQATRDAAVKALEKLS